MIQESRFLYYEDVVTALRQEYLIEGNPENIKFDKITTLDEADEFSLIWIKPTTQGKSDIIKQTRAKAIICDMSINVTENEINDKCLIKVTEPKYAIINIINKYFKTRYEAGIHNSTVISPEAQVAADVYVGANTYIGKAEIGRGVVIEGNCFIYDNSVIKDNVVIQAGVVIASDGFGHFKANDKRLLHFPHIGRVVLENDTHIGSNTVIDRGVLGDTVIGKGSKINKMCVISHNVSIGCNNFIAHSVCINGSASIGDNNFLGSGAVIKNKVAIGNETIVGMGAVVVNNVPDRSMVYGNPAKIVKRSPNKPLF